MLGLERGDAQIHPSTVNSRDVKRLSENKNLAVDAEGLRSIGPINWLAFNPERKTP